MWFLFGLLACTNGKTKTTDSSESENTQQESDAETEHEDIDTNTEESGAEEELARDVVTFLLSGSYTGATLSLVQILTDGEEEFEVGDTFASTVADADSVIIFLDEPTLLEPLDEGGHIALFMPMLHLDTDEDAEHEEGEEIYGIGSHFLLYTKNATELNLEDGWWSVEFNPLREEELGFQNIDNVPLHANLTPTQALEISGSSEFTGSQNRIAVVPIYALLQGLSYDDIIIDFPATESWSITLTDPPPATHMLPLDRLNTTYAYEMPLLYTDGDENGLFSIDADLPHSGLCFGTENLPINLLYYPTMTEKLLAMHLSWGGLSIGWTAFIMDETEQIYPLSAEESVGLQFSSDCVDF